MIAAILCHREIILGSRFFGKPWREKKNPRNKNHVTTHDRTESWWNPPEGEAFNTRAVDSEVSKRIS